jgi:diguanylate cyclase (GGDEF)-like protein
LNALYLEISVVGICLLLIILFNQYQNIGSSTLQRQFNLLIYCTIVMMAVDAACWLIDGTAFPHARAWNMAIETVYYFLNILIPYLWVVYVEIAVSRDQKIDLRRIQVLALPLAILAVMLLINLHTQFVFTISQDNVYRRGTGFAAFAVVAFMYLIHAAFRALLTARRAPWKEEKRRYTPMALFMVLPAVGGLIQTFCFGVTLIWIFVAVAIMMLYIDSLNRQISADPLTGINNRRELNRYLLRETRDPAYDGILALIMMDVDNFKQVNDTYGHYVGDGVLIAVAEILKQACKHTSAFLARYGGDEFCIVYPAENTGTVDAMIGRILADTARQNDTRGGQAGIGLSIGYAVWQPDTDKSVDDLYKRADQQMYRIKSAKKSA